MWTTFFSMLSRDGGPKKLLESVNKEDKNIKFTKEIEKESILNYLYVKIIRTEDGKIETTVYRKPNSSSEIINKKCKTLYTYKVAALRAYVNRATVICSTQNLMKEEVNMITILGEKSGYNKKIVKQLYEARIKKLNRIQSGKKENSQ